MPRNIRNGFYKNIYLMNKISALFVRLSNNCSSIGLEYWNLNGPLFSCDSNIVLMSFTSAYCHK